jgi:phage repressor protein C with HTH and peptisase S24 domain
MDSEEKKDLFIQRLCEIRGDMSTRAFSRACGLTNSIVRKYFSGSIPSADKAVKIADAMGVNLRWLITGEGEKSVSGNQVKKELKIINSDFGDFYNNVEDDVFTSFLVPENLFNCMGVNSDAVTGFFIKTESMLPTFKVGDIVFVDASLKKIKDGGVYVFEYQNKDFIKRLQVIGKKVRVISDNSATYPSFIVDDVSELKIIGRIKSKLSNL